MTPANSKDASMKQHIEACQASNLSHAAYCQQHDIPSHIFSYYRKKLGYVTSSKAVSSKNQLIPINLLSESINSGKIKISHSNGFSLEINSDTDLNQIKPVLELLRTVS
ncbi:MAG: hypothetical protein GQ546_01915 [Gammaproteobacteria bacterium]|nr:hypothetical protein [Gammaproteobacteria bacterium]